MENRKNIDDLFKEQLGGYTETPPPAAWGALEKNLKAAPPGSTGNTRRRIIYAAITGCLLLMLTFSVTQNMPGLFHAGNNAATVSETAPIAQATSDNGNDKQGTSTGADATTLPATAAGNNASNNPANSNVNTATQSNATAGTTTAANGKAASSTTNRSAHNPSGSKQNAINTAGLYKPIDKKHCSGTTAARKGHSHSYFSSKAYRIAKVQTALENDRMPENVYNGTIAKPAAAGNNDVAAANEDKTDANDQAPANQKKETPESKPDSKQPAPDKPKQPKLNIPRFEAGVKIGFERGFNNDAGRKIIMGPYVQYNLSEKFAVLTQPSFKAGKVDAQSIGSPKSYYRGKNDSTYTATDQPVPVVDAPFYIQHFRYTESHDSIVKTNSVGGTYYEFELPALLKYKVTKGFSVYGGPNMVYSKLMTVTEHTRTLNVVQTQDNIQGLVYADGSIYRLPPVNQILTYGGTPYSAYSGPDYAGTKGSEFRFGYMLGFSWNLDKHWLFDGLLQQTQTSANYKAGYNVNTALTAPYFRFTIGYKLTR